MFAVQTRAGSGTDEQGPTLEFCQMETPIPEFSQVVINVSFAGVNQADLLQARGSYPPPAGSSNVLGLEVAGTVSDIGSGVTRFSPGDSVVALLPAGGYAESVAVDQSLVLPLPKGLSLERGAGLMEAACTAWNNLVQVGQLQAGQYVLIQGASGGVGSFAIQLASARGATVLASARTEQRAQRCLELGAHTAFAYEQYDDFTSALPQLVATHTGNHGVDVILDVLGAQYLPAHIASLATDGRLVTIGMQRGTRGELNFAALLAKRASVHGTTLRSRPLSERAAIVEAVHTYVWPLVESGHVIPQIHQTMPLAQAAEAHTLLASGEVFGKLILDCRNPTS